MSCLVDVQTARPYRRSAHRTRDDPSFLFFRQPLDEAAVFRHRRPELLEISGFDRACDNFELFARGRAVTPRRTSSDGVLHSP